MSMTMSMTADDIVLHVPELRRYARQLTRDNNAADDLLQDRRAASRVGCARS